MQQYRTPGVYREDISLALATAPTTGVPAFLGLTVKRPEATDDPGALAVRRWPEFENKFGAPSPEGYLAQAVRGFYDNGGGLCYVQPIEDLSRESLERGLAAIASLEAGLRTARGASTEIQAELAPILRDLRGAVGNLRDTTEALRRSPGQALFGAPPPRERR